MAEHSNSEAGAITNDPLSQNQVERIRQRAYELYEARGGEPGHEIDDWLQSEAEVGIEK